MFYTNSAEYPTLFIAQGRSGRSVFYQAKGTEVYGELHNSVFVGRVSVGKGKCRS